MSHAPKFNIISVDELPQYPISRDERLDGNSFVKWNTARWISSRTFKLMSWEYQGMARALFDLCQTESPIGTLPNDDPELAYMLRVKPEMMSGLRQLEFGPLRNWKPCRCGDDIRLMHPVVLQQVQDALERRELAKLSKEDKAISMRLSRLRKGLLDAGLSQDVVSDDVLIKDMDEWLTANKRGNRTASAYQAVILFALRSGWFSPSHVSSEQ